MEDIKIKSLNIKSYTKIFSIYDRDFKEDINRREKYLSEIENFRNNHTIASEVEKNGYEIETIFTYYTGEVVFFPVQKDGTEISLQVKLDKQMMDTIIVMSLDSVCGVCEKQTQAFQDVFIKYTEGAKNSISNVISSVKQSVNKRLKDKLLTAPKTKE
jgi:hypothetical protein